MLNAIATLEGPSQASVCVETGVDRSTSADRMQHLCTVRLVVRTRSKKDGRAYVLSLTDDGAACFDGLASTVGQAEQHVTAPPAVSDRRKLLDLLQGLSRR